MAYKNSSIVKQRSVIEFLYKSDETCAVNIHKKLLNVYKDETIDISTVRRWLNRFKNEERDVHDRPRSGRPSTSNNSENELRLEQLVQKDRRITIREIAESLGISLGSVETLLRNCGLRKLASKWIPKCLTREMMAKRKEICEDLLAEYGSQIDTFKGVITGDETWLFHYDPETKKQSMEWYHKNSPVKKKPRLSKSSQKIMASVFWDENGVILIDYLEKNSTINKTRYCQTLDKLKRAINRKRPELREYRIIIHQDNARPHTALQTMEKIAKLGWTIMPHPPYSPDLAASDFFLFGHLKRHLRGKQFESDEELKKTVQNWFKSKDSSFYQTAFTSWRQRWSDCVEKGGGYIE